MLRHTLFGCASRTRREQSIRPKISRIDFDLIDLKFGQDHPNQWLNSTQVGARRAEQRRAVEGVVAWLEAFERETRDALAAQTRDADAKRAALRQRLSLIHI